MNWVLLKNSLLVSGLATLAAVGLGLAAALCLACLSGRCRSLLLAMAVISLALPPFLVTNCWLHLLGAAGIWRSWLPLNIFSLGGAVWILSLLLWPITLFVVTGAWRRLEPSQLESDPAVTGWALVRGLLLPLGWNAMGQAAVLTFVLALNNFAVSAILQVKVFPAEMWVRFNTSFDTLGTLRMSWPLLLAPLVMLLWLRRQEIPWPRIEGSVSPELFRQQLGACWVWSCGALAAALGFLSVCLPLLQLTLVKRTWTELPGALAAGQSAVWNSFWFAASSASTIVVAALLFGRKQGPIGWLLWLLFLIPGVLLGISLIKIFNRPSTTLFYQSSGIVIVALVLRYLAPGWGTVGHALRGVDPDLTDAARIEGATRWQMLRQVWWPQIAPQIAASWYVVFLLCLWDVESMILVVPPDGETLALKIFNLLHYGHNAQVNALCITLLAIALLPLALRWLWVVARRALGAGAVRYPVSAAGFVLFALLLLAGCAPQGNPNQARLQSSVFSNVRVYGKRGVGVGELNKPRSVAVDTQDNFYVVDMTGRVQKFSPDGVFQLSWQMPQTDLGKPKGMGRDREGRIIVIEPHYQRLNYFSTAGKLLQQWGQKGTNTGQLMMPRAVAVNSRGETFVSEYGEVERVQVFALVTNESSPRFVKSLGRPGTGPGEFNRPEGLCVDSQDRLYVADSCNHRIQVFSSDGKFLRAYGKAGRGKGELSYPYDICVDAAGRQYVCEFGNSRIQVFDRNDQPLEIIGGPGAEPGMFNNPWSIALDSAGNLYVADSQNHRVQKLMRSKS